MQWIVEDRLSNFQFWSGGKDRAEKFTASQLDQIGEELEDLFSTIPTDTQINDLFWFEPEQVANLIGLEMDEDGNIR